MVNPQVGLPRTRSLECEALKCLGNLPRDWLPPRPFATSGRRILATNVAKRFVLSGSVPALTRPSRQSHQPKTVGPAFVGVIRIKQRRCLIMASPHTWLGVRRSVEWSGALDAALTATRRDDLKHGTNAAYVAGSVCKECRE
jgi:hypothetical protein